MGKIVTDRNTVKVSGRLSIPDAVQLKALLQETAGTYGEVALDLTGTESLDLACIQVLCSANRRFRKEGKGLRTRGGLPEGVKRSLEDLALDPGGCALESPEECLWVTGAGNE